MRHTLWFIAALTAATLFWFWVDGQTSEYFVIRVIDEDPAVAINYNYFTDSFSGAKEKTPRYNYNQVMYRLRIDDQRLREAQE